jgi:hypothetical protein
MMNWLPIIFLIVLVVLFSLIVIFSWILFKKRYKKKPSLYVIIGILFIAISLGFENRRIIGFSFIAIGILLAMLDIFRGVLKKR